MAENPGFVHTKDRILDVAVRMFSDRGYDKVSMRDIAGAVGITAPSIYNHFSSKNDLLGSIYDFYAEQQVALDTMRLNGTMICKPFEERAYL